MAAPKDIRSADVLGMKVTSNDGVIRENLEQVKPGAKDSLSGTNVTEPFQGQGKGNVPSPYGGFQKNFK